MDAGMTTIDIGRHYDQLYYLCLLDYFISDDLVGGRDEELTDTID
jgi:hypothetical protein